MFVVVLLTVNTSIPKVALKLILTLAQDLHQQLRGSEQVGHKLITSHCMLQLFVWREDCKLRKHEACIKQEFNSILKTSYLGHDHSHINTVPQEGTTSKNYCWLQLAALWRGKYADKSFWNEIFSIFGSLVHDTQMICKQQNILQCKINIYFNEFLLSTITWW